MSIGALKLTARVEESPLKTKTLASLTCSKNTGGSWISGHTSGPLLDTAVYAFVKRPSTLPARKPPAALP